ncbi:glyoxalase [Virgisporangium aliadipatigenens]|uniref:Glyoxalase n=1 Tax=Virgisporangium aliadipatigenens TaxID=741659 RepID=A0A8J3YKA7_9ACTN|nr:VOC family protein [Virgisporangium aliadipatigenens]GIJ45847.1 glyoxalase [Virgisporangium aliadipatigenens]
MNGITHFAINADDVPATRRFYERVFGWRFTPFGPPDFYRIETPDGGPGGAIQRRRELVPGRPTVGFECTVEVADLDATAAAVIAAGGRIVLPESVIAGVGRLFFFADPDGNVAGAIEYRAAAE